MTSAIAFRTGEAKVYVRHAPKIRIADTEYGPYTQETRHRPNGGRAVPALQEGGEDRTMTDEYRILYDAWKREKQRPDIQPLPEGFYTAMTAYATQLREQSRTQDKTTVKGKLVEKERDHAEKMLQDLNRLRLSKLVHAELNGAPIEPLNLTAEEKRLQVELRRLLAAHTQGLKQTLQGKEPKI